MALGTKIQNLPCILDLPDIKKKLSPFYKFTEPWICVKSQKKVMTQSWENGITDGSFIKWQQDLMGT